MFEGQLLSMLWLAAGLGLFGLAEPCTFGSSVLFTKFLEGRDRVSNLAQTVIFMLTRAFIRHCRDFL